MGKTNIDVEKPMVFPRKIIFSYIVPMVSLGFPRNMTVSLWVSLGFPGDVQVLLFAPAVGSAGGGGGALQPLHAAGPDHRFDGLRQQVDAKKMGLFTYG